MIDLTSKQRKILEKAAHHIEPMVIIGQNGVTEAQSNHVKNAFKTHEILKVKFNEFKEGKQELANWIAEDTDSTLVRIIGNVATFYRQAENPENRKIKL